MDAENYYGVGTDKIEACPLSPPQSPHEFDHGANNAGPARFARLPLETLQGTAASPAEVLDRHVAKLNVEAGFNEPHESSRVGTLPPLTPEPPECLESSEGVRAWHLGPLVGTSAKVVFSDKSGRARDGRKYSHL